MRSTAHPDARRPDSLRLRRALFWTYTLGLFTATHWPKAEIPGPPNTDKVLHVLVFGVWTLLFVLASYIRPIRRLASLATVAAIGAVWTGLDELLQAVPFVNRHATLDDYTANLIGVGVGLAAGVIAAPLMEQGRRRHRAAGPTIGPLDPGAPRQQ